MDFLEKIIFNWKRQKLVVVSGEGKELCARALDFILENNFRVALIASGKIPHYRAFWRADILIFLAPDSKELLRNIDFNFLLKKSGDPALVAGKEQIDMAVKLAKMLPARGCLISNFDANEFNELFRENKNCILRYGFNEGAELRISDLNLDDMWNFKLSYKGSTVPFWLAQNFSERQISQILSSIAAALISGMNLVQISQKIKDFQPQ